MFLVIALAVLGGFVAVIGSVLLISIDRAASVADNPSMDLALTRK